MQVCLLCVVNDKEHKEMPPAQRILRQATRVDIAELPKRPSNADGAAVDMGRVILYMQPYLSGWFEKQKLKNENIDFKHMSKPELCFEILQAFIRAGHIEKG